MITMIIYGIACLLFFSGIGFFIWARIKINYISKKADISLIYDTGNRFDVLFHNLKNKKRFDFKGGTYAIHTDAVYYDNGRILTEHWNNKTNPLKRVGENKESWTDAITMKHLMTNQIMSDIVTAKNKDKNLQIFIMLGIGLACGILIIIALKIFNVIK